MFNIALNASEANRTILIQMVDVSDSYSPITGLTLIVQLIKPGEDSYITINPVVTDLGNGTYRLVLPEEAVDTVGIEHLYITDVGGLALYNIIQIQVGSSSNVIGAGRGPSISLTVPAEVNCG